MPCTVIVMIPLLCFGFVCARLIIVAIQRTRCDLSKFLTIYYIVIDHISCMIVLNLSFQNYRSWL